jgi:GNAT superfamily N-acetyltransferase
MTFSWNLRKYRNGDEQAILELLNIVFRSWGSLEYWEWKFKKNPAGSPIIWLAECGARVIGHCSIIPIRMKVGNSYVIGGLTCDLATHPDYEGKGIFSSLLNRCIMDAAENDIILTWGFAAAHLGPVYKRYQRIGHICFLNRMIKVLDWEPLLTRYVSNRYLVHAIARVLSKLRRSKPACENSIIIKEISHFDDNIGIFWQEISQHFTIIVERDQEYLNWKYVDQPENEFTIYLAVEKNKILGYSVLCKTRHEDLTIGNIVDILGFGDHRNVVGSLIFRSLEHFRKSGVSMVNCTIPEKHPYKSILSEAGFITDPLRRSAIYASINLPGSRIDEKEVYTQALKLSQSSFLKEKKNWFIMIGDGD